MAFPCCFSFLLPFAARPSTAECSNPASPRTPICIEGRLDSSSAAVERVRAPSSPGSPFTAPVEKKTSSRELDPAAFVIGKLDEGWFESNVISFQWSDVCSFSWTYSGPSTGDLMFWASRNLKNSETQSVLSPRIRVADLNLGKSASQPLFSSIEMVQPRLGSGGGSCLSAADRDPRGLPGVRLRELPRVFPNDEISLSDGELRRYLRSFRPRSGDAPKALPEFGDRRIEPTEARSSLRRRRGKQIFEVVGSSRRFSDGEEPGESTSAPLLKVKEKGEFQFLTDSSGMTYKISRVSKKSNGSVDASVKQFEGDPETKIIALRAEAKKARKDARNSTKFARHTGKLVAGPSDKERRRPQLVESNSVPAPPTRRRRRERRKSSKSLTDVEYDELRGCIDLGFNFTRDDLTPRVISVFPGLKFYKDGDDLLHSPNKSSPRSRVRSPTGWTKYSDSHLLKWRIPSPQDSGVDMKAHLKFWAHSVASTVSAEC